MNLLKIIKKYFKDLFFASKNEGITRDKAEQKAFRIYNALPRNSRRRIDRRLRNQLKKRRE